MIAVKDHHKENSVCLGHYTSFVSGVLMRYKLSWLMSIVLVFCLILGVCTSTPDKFAHGQDVLVHGGFYRGQVGVIKKRHFFWGYSVLMPHARYDGHRRIAEWNMSSLKVDNEEI